jgi:hypothetical protein
MLFTLNPRNVALSCLVGLMGSIAVYNLSGHESASLYFGTCLGALWFATVTLLGSPFWDVVALNRSNRPSLDDLRERLSQGLRQLEVRTTACSEVARALVDVRKSPFYRNRLLRCFAVFCDDGEIAPLTIIVICVSGFTVALYDQNLKVGLLTGVFGVTVTPLVFLMTRVARRIVYTQYQRARHDIISQTREVKRTLSVLNNRVTGASLVHVEAGVNRIQSCCERCLRTNKRRVEHGQAFVCLILEEGASEVGPRFWVDESGRIVER